VDESGITQYFCPDSSSTVSNQNLTYVLQLMHNLDTDIIINQSGINPYVLKGLARIRPEGVRLLSVHHNCIRCLLEHHSTIIKENYKHHILFRLMNNKGVYYILNYMNKLKYGRYFKNCIRYSDRLVLLSEKFIPELKTYIRNYPEHKVTGIPNPAPFKAAKDKSLEKENRLLYVGRINFQQKRADRIIEVWKRLFPLYPDWEFDVVGDGPALEDLKKMAEYEDLERIYFHGYCDPEPYLKRAKIFTLTSDFEGFGMVLVEAQAFGVVPVAFRCFSAIGDIIKQSKNGVIVDEYDLNQFVAELKKLMDDEPVRAEMGKAALNSVKDFAPAAIMDKWNRLFEEVI
jgi:glycosyltransferase involved in cell wall biosynthesis